MTMATTDNAEDKWHGTSPLGDKQNQERTANVALIPERTNWTQLGVTGNRNPTLPVYQ
jgi:hypothetical protein